MKTRAPPAVNSIAIGAKDQAIDKASAESFPASDQPTRAGRAYKRTAETLNFNLS